MFLEPPSVVLRLVQWEDMISFHVRLFRCFLLGILDTHSELAVLSQGSEWLAGVGFMHDAGYLYEPVSHRAFSPGRSNDAMIRCPPRRRYDATSIPPFSVNSPTDPITPIPPPFIFPHPINITHGLYDESTPPAVAFYPPGSGLVLAGYDGLRTGVVGFILLWLLTLAVVVPRGPGSARTMFQPPRGVVGLTTNPGKRMIRPLAQGRLPIGEATHRVVIGTPEDVGHQATMPGAWLNEHQEQSMLETLDESIFDMAPWTPLYCCVHTGMKAWLHFPDLTLIFGVLSLWNRSSSDVVTIERGFEDSSLVCQGLEAGGSMSAELHGSEQQDATRSRSSSESSLSIGSLRGSTTATLTRYCEPLAIGDVPIKDPDIAGTTGLDVGCRNTTGLTFALVASSHANRPLYTERISSDVDEGASEDGCDGIEDEGLTNANSQRTDTLALERKHEYRTLGRRRDSALSHIGSPLLLRRARSAGYLWKKRDVFDDDDEETGDDSYWTEQVNARLLGGRGSRRGSCQYGWTDVTSWSREGRKDETDNWRTRNSQLTHVAAHEKTSDSAVRCQADSDSTKLSRYPTTPLNMDTSLCHRVGSGNGSHGIYIVPQKRGRTTRGRCWSPVSSPQPSNRPSGLGFFPFRKTPLLLTPEAWRPGCLYIPEPPEDEARQADAWWDSLGSVGRRGSASGAGHRCGTGTMIQDVAELGSLFSRDAPDGPVSWRDRHENDPASRLFTSVHRRAMTQG